jgi:hypothetical protein
MNNLVFYKYAPNNNKDLEFEDFHTDSIHDAEVQFFTLRKEYFYSMFDENYNIVTNQNDIAELDSFCLVLGFDDSFRQLFELIERDDFNQLIQSNRDKIKKIVFWEMDTDWTNFTGREYDAKIKKFKSYFKQLSIPYKIFSTALKFNYDDSVGYFAAQNAMTMAKLLGEMNTNDYYEYNLNGDKTKYFYSAANSINTDRLHFYKFIDDNNLWDKNNISLFSTYKNMELSAGFNYSKIVYEYNKGKGGIYEIDDDYTFYPHPFEDEEFKTMDYKLLTNLRRYGSSLFEMIFETMYEACENKIIQTSEKLLKPFAQKKAFLTFSYKGILNEFKQLGFKTFDYVFYEGYDEFDNHSDRLYSVLNQYKNICSRDINELKEIVKENNHIIEHNYSNLLLLMDKFKSDIKKEVTYE